MKKANDRGKSIWSMKIIVAILCGRIEFNCVSEHGEKSTEAMSLAHE